MPDSNLRNLSSTKLLAARLAYSGSNIALREVQELPLATQQTKKYLIPLVCSRTGLVVGSFSTITVAGHMPLLGQWKDTQVLHPLFSLGPVALLQFARNSWLRFCALTPEETSDGVIVQQQETLLRVAALGMLYNLTEIRQDIPWLPEWKTVADQWQSLMALGYWKAYLDSERFKFPSIRISQLERDVDLKSFLKLCWERKKEYETRVNESIEQEKLRFAERAMIAIRDDIAGKKPLSIKILWRWFEQQMPRRYDKDMQGWMWDLFSATEHDVLDFTVRDIELFEEIFLSEVELGSSISHACLEIIRGKHKLLTQHFDTYEILIPESIAAGVADGSIVVGEEPMLANYPSRVKWLIAHSKWKLAQPSARKHQEAAASKNRTITVSPSFVPRLSIGIDEEPEEEDDDVLSLRELTGRLTMGDNDE